MNGTLRSNCITFPYLPSYARSDDPSLLRRHTTSPQAGRALEILGHAIDYLEDELARESNSMFEDRGRLQAIQFLKARSREIYFACPVALTLGERLHEIKSHLYESFARAGRKQ